MLSILVQGRVISVSDSALVIAVNSNGGFQREPKLFVKPLEPLKLLDSLCKTLSLSLYR